jgi:hypothetical protein
VVKSLGDARPHYDHKFPSCERTYATLVVYSDRLDVDAISKALRVKPTSTVIKGQRLSPLRRKRRIARHNGWFFSSEGKRTSRDLRAHLDYILDRLAPAQSKLRRLTRAGCETCLSVFWDSAAGNGGPLLDPRILARLAAFRVELRLDIYFSVFFRRRKVTDVFGK